MSRQKPGERDYRDLKNKDTGKAMRDPGRSNRNDTVQPKWWDKTGEKCAQSIHDWVAHLQKNQTSRMRQNVVSARLYGNLSLVGSAGAAYARLLESQQRAVKDRLTYNATQSVIDTLVSKVGENKPRPYYLTSGGSYRQQRKAKKLNQFIEGVFYEAETYDVGIDAFRDAAIFGDGLVHVYADGGRICHERVLLTEIWLDEVEAQYGYPRNLHRVKLVDREALAERFPEYEKLIMECPRAVETEAQSSTNISDMVTVAESWHLGAPDSEGKFHGGKHAIALLGAGEMLVEPEDWAHDFFPFARIPWCKRPLGYWSQGLCEQLQGEQLELNKELWMVQRSMHLAGSFKVLLPNGSKVVNEAISNEIGAVIKYAGPNEPKWIVPPPISEVYFNNIERIIERMYRKAGVSEMSAASRKPPGLNSGRAIREAQDIESDRHRSIQRANDKFYLDIARLSIAIANDEGSRLKQVRAPGRGSFSVVNWKKDIQNVEADETVLQCFPVSRLPRDPAARLQTIQEYVQAGFITPRQGRKALDFADIDAVESLGNAQEEVITKTLDAIIDDGEMNPPEPTDDLSLCRELVLEYIQHYRTTDIEPEKLEMLRTWNKQVDMLQQAAQQQILQQQMATQAAMQPPAAPMPRPRSDLVANVPTPGAPAPTIQ